MEMSDPEVGAWLGLDFGIPKKILPEKIQPSSLDFMKKSRKIQEILEIFLKMLFSRARAPQPHGRPNGRRGRPRPSPQHVCRLCEGWSGAPGLISAIPDL